MSSPPILIIGAGVSGLTLAQGLLKSTKIPFHIYERDPSLHARAQGYRVRVSGEGIASLRHNLPPARFQKVLSEACAFVADGSTHNGIDVIVDAITGRPGELKNIWGHNMADKGVMHEHPDQDDKPLAVDRGVLREVLYEGMEEYLTYNKQVEHYKELDDGTVQAIFKDGTTATGCALVGADGAFSHVRRQLLPHYSLKDSEARVIWGKADLTPEFLSALTEEARHGLGVITESHLKCLFEAMRFDHSHPELTPSNYFYWLLYPRKEALFGLTDAEYLHLSRDEAADLAKKLTKDWAPSIRVPFEKVNKGAASVNRLPTATPDIPSWDDDNGGPLVTLMGDGIHSMAPTAALGASTALRDSFHLATNLEKLQDNAGPSDIKKALRQYEAEMRPYAADALNKSAMGGKVMFGFRGWEALPEIEMHP